MTRPNLSLLLGVHAHQPVGNFTEVIALAHERSYGPFLRTLHRYPGFRYAVHFSGWLLEELMTRYPEDMALLGAMVARGQVELFGGGDCEPVLAAIPGRDRKSQLEALSDRLETHFGVRPTGAWLTERVWESTVVPALRDCGLHYVTVDDYHFLCAGCPPSALDGFHTTEEEGARLDLFPISEALRYRLPFAPAAEAVDYLEQLAARGDRAAVYFDDIEKFGIWPETYEWVYERGWLTEFIERVLASPVITTATYREFHARERSRGVIYLPTTSYSEMNEWTLPASAAADYAALLRQLREQEDWARQRPFVRGGIWRNFLTRYPEANWMHKRMLGLSARLASHASPEPAWRAALHRAQANDAYWHGLFGGLYLPHLRRSVWHNLISLEAALDAATGTRQRPDGDVDCDGWREIFLCNETVQLVLRDDGLGAAHELVSYPLRHNFADTLRRHAEHYHHASDAVEGSPAAGREQSGIASPHERAHSLTGLEDSLHGADSRGRLLCIDEVVTPDGQRTTLNGWRVVAASADELLLVHAWQGREDGLRKKWRVLVDSALVDYAAHPDLSATAFEIELNLSMPACGGFGGRFALADGSIAGGLGQPLSLQEISELRLEDAVLEGAVVLSVDPPCAMRAEPLCTVSQSEAGLEQIMQAVTVRLHSTSLPLQLGLGFRPCVSWL